MLQNYVILAKKDAEKIAKDLRKYPNKTFSKGSISTNYNLPHNRSSRVFDLLQSMGFTVTKFNVTVPGSASA